MSYVSVCKNAIASNNKRGWKHPFPPIRISESPNGKAVDHASTVAIEDKDGNVVAVLYATTNGKPVLKCGAKVALQTTYPARVVG